MKLLQCLPFVFAGSLIAQPVSISITADNYYAVYDGPMNAAVTRHFDGTWSAVKTTMFPSSPGNFVYVVAWDDGSVYNGLLAHIGFGGGYATTGSPLWEVCAVGQKITGGSANAPTAAALTARIVTCNNGGWHATSNGPANANSPGVPLWPKINGIDDSAAWVWDRNGTQAC